MDVALRANLAGSGFAGACAGLRAAVRGRHHGLVRALLMLPGGSGMRRTLRVIAMVSTFAGVAGATDVHIGVNIGVPAPPPIVVTAPPPLVVVPTTPAVRYAPSLSVNLFVYGGRYYTYDNGAWFIASAYDGPWAYIERTYVPRPVLVVPARYYRVPPRHGHPHGMPPGQA